MGDFERPADAKPAIALPLPLTERPSWTNLGRINVVALTIVLALAATLRFHGIGAHFFWVDEVYSIQMAAGHPLHSFGPPTDRLLPNGSDSTNPFYGNARDVIRAMGADTHPPLYELILRYWRQWVGVGDSATRSLSVVFGLLAIVFVWDAVTSFHGRVAAFWAALMMAVATLQIDFSQEARSYILAVMWVGCSLAATARIVTAGPNRRREIALIVSLFCGVATHYYFVAVFAASMAFATVQRPPIRTSLWRCGIIAALLLLALLGPLLLQQRGSFRSDMSWAQDLGSGLLKRSIGRLFRIPLRWFMRPVDAPWWFSLIFAILFLVPPWLLVRRRPPLLLWLLTATSALALVMAADLINGTKMLEEPRYTLPGSPAAYALAAAVFCDNRRFRHLLPAVMVLGALLCLPQAYEQVRKVNWDKVAGKVAKWADPAEPLVFFQDIDQGDIFSPILQAGITRYNGLGAHPQLLLTRRADAYAVDELKKHKAFWLFCGPAMEPAAQAIPGVAPTGRLVTAAFVGSAYEYRFETPASPQTRLAPSTAAH